MKRLRLAILGASGAVGQEMLKLIEEYDIPVSELILLAGSKSAGSEAVFRGEKLRIRKTDAESFKGMDYVFGAVTNSVSERYAPAAIESGAVYIDNSSAFRLDEKVPLVVPEINGEEALNNSGLIANPNCSTIIGLMAIGGIARLSRIEAITASTYQAVSGAGQAGFEALTRETDAWLCGESVEPSVFPAQIAFNVIPFIGTETPNLYTDEEMKLQNEGRKILGLPDMRVTCTCVRVPVMRSHSISLSVRTKEKISVEQARAAIGSFPGCRLMNGNDARSYPTPLDTSGQDEVWVGRVRESLSEENTLSLWCCGDQIRKGAAANAIQIMQYIEEKNNIARKRAMINYIP